MQTIFAKLKELLEAVLNQNAALKRIEGKQNDLATFALGLDHKLAQVAQDAVDARAEQKAQLDAVLAALGSPGDQAPDDTTAQQAIDAEAGELKSEIDQIDADIQAQK